MTRVLFFGRLRDIAGHGARDIDLSPELATVGDLRGWIGKDNALLAEALSPPTIRVSIDQVICVHDSASIEGAKEIAFMPPLSGG